MEEDLGKVNSAARPIGAEGVIKFTVGGHSTAGALPEANWAELERWRSELRSRGLVGRDAATGLGYGNLSVRRAAGGFVITGSQTGGLERLDGRHYSLVEAWDLASNRVERCGPALPSSESLSHAALYAADPRIGAVVHVHSASLWRRMLDAGELSAGADLPYGSVALYTRLGELARGREALPFIVVLAGHEDGVFAAGRALDETCAALLARVERRD